MEEKRGRREEEGFSLLQALLVLQRQASGLAAVPPGSGVSGMLDLLLSLEHFDFRFWQS